MRKVRNDSLHGGEVFGRLTVIEYSHTCKNGRHSERVMNCKCECGATVQVRTSNLKSGNTVSCGCYHKQRTVSANQKRKLNKVVQGIRLNNGDMPLGTFGGNVYD